MRRIFLVLLDRSSKASSAEPDPLARGIDVDEQRHLLELPAIGHEAVRVVGAIRNLEGHGAELRPGAEDRLLALAESFLDVRVAASSAQGLALDQSAAFDFQSNGHNYSF